MIGDCRNGARVDADLQFGADSRWMRTLGIGLSRKGLGENRFELEHHGSSINRKVLSLALIDFQ